MILHMLNINNTDEDNKIEPTININKVDNFIGAAASIDEVNNIGQMYEIDDQDNLL